MDEDEAVSRTSLECHSFPRPPGQSGVSHCLFTAHAYKCQGYTQVDVGRSCLWFHFRGNIPHHRGVQLGLSLEFPSCPEYVKSIFSDSKCALA